MTRRFTMPKNIKVGVITHAQGAHLDAYFASLNIPEVESVALADPGGGHTIAMAKKLLKGKLQQTFKGPTEMLTVYRPEVALISMEAALAPPLIDQALNANCHVFAEKPSCVRVEDFEPLVRKAQEKHRH